MFFLVNLVISLFLFNFCVLKNQENHKKNTKIKGILIVKREPRSVDRDGL